MNPQAPQQQNYQPPTTAPQPSVPPVTSEQPAAPTPPLAPSMIEAPQKSHKKLALWLLIGPSALFVVTIVLFALFNFAFGAAQPADGDLVGDNSPIKAILNIIFFLSGMVTIVTWLPGLIIGIILLAKQSK